MNAGFKSAFLGLIIHWANLVLVLVLGVILNLIFPNNDVVAWLYITMVFLFVTLASTITGYIAAHLKSKTADQTTKFYSYCVKVSLMSALLSVVLIVIFGICLAINSAAIIFNTPGNSISSVLYGAFIIASPFLGVLLIWILGGIIGGLLGCYIYKLKNSNGIITNQI